MSQPNFTHDQIVACLADGSAWPDGGPVETRETHISTVFLTPLHAWKLLKPVDFGFLDFSTREARYIDCWNHLLFNPLAPGVYLDVVPVTQRLPAPGDGSREPPRPAGRQPQPSAGGQLPGAGQPPRAGSPLRSERPQGELEAGGRGRVVDWLVKMRRLPDEATLEAGVRAGTATTAEIDRVLDRLVTFFRTAPVVRPAARRSRFRAFRANLVDNLDVLDRFDARGGLPERGAARLRSAQLQLVETESAVIQQRIDEGWFREGHGDLRAEHVYFTDPPVIMDAIEFNRRFRQVDTLDEVGFLATDLERLGRSDLAAHVLADYRRRTADPAPPTLEGLYLSYRFAVRAKVACLRGAEQKEPQQRESFRLAAASLEAALRHCVPHHRPLLVCLVGLSGAGKSVVAAALAKRIGGRRLSSDVLRKKLCGYAPLDRPADPALYSPETTERTYAALNRRARGWLSSGVSVVLDATFQQRSQRLASGRMADGVGVEWLFVKLRCPEAVLRERVARRRERGGDPSDADLAVLDAQLRAFEPLDELPAGRRLVLDGCRPREESVDAVLSRIRRPPDVSG